MEGEGLRRKKKAVPKLKKKKAAKRRYIPPGADVFEMIDSLKQHLGQLEDTCHGIRVVLGNLERGLENLFADESNVDLDALQQELIDHIEQLKRHRGRKMKKKSIKKKKKR